MAKILIIDDEANIRESLYNALTKRGHRCVTAGSAAEGRTFAKSGFDLVLLDVFLGDGNGLDVLKDFKKQYPDRTVIMISGHADIDTAVQAIRQGAYDFIEKPLSLDRILITIENATRTASLRDERERLTSRLFGDFIGESDSITKIRNEIIRSAPRAERFLILGKNGTGKELAAHLIHQHSRRSDGPFVAVNCAALPSELIESELFGHLQGAFTGATKNRRGRFLEATSGTIFLDEIGDMPLEAQAKILRATETREITPVGSDKSHTVDCNIIAATNHDIQELVEAGTFREDLYYRLNVVTITIPALRERPSDIPLLSEYFLNRFAADGGTATKTLTRRAETFLKKLPFPGNVRELRNLMERVGIYCDHARISPDDLAELLPKRYTPEIASLKEALESYEKQLINDAIGACDGNITEAARQLGLERSHLYKKMKKLGIRET